ncbi:4'-phosphopantetheinyl transferase superfamily protein [Enterococcus sp. BWB1-3]|uniref:4'-phosphopantetheinyl transferase family protein n=1 Tax=Enterococcus sp. BWB1-3 TaxID=2787713 RepID=UPI00192078AA|nr:4'-phosphopantetheinyl transferase superfamily protein [Enterococcus sp. BWB1-3]MBL1228788.1 4'-phosphopantetheinyl transferase superfamily protein [Enterococcus sp. BWB1-3]
MKIYAVNINNCHLNNQDLKQHLPEKAVKSIARYKNPIDYRRSLIAYAVLFAICEQTQEISRELVLEKNEYGKPFFQDLPNYSFNISHSKDWIVLAVSSAEVGIDIEYNEPFDHDEVVESFFAESEKQFFFRTITNQETKVFYRFWTLKESYIKAVGKGMTVKLDSFSIELWNRPISINNDKRFELLEIPFVDDYTLSVCFEKGEKIEAPKILNIAYLISGKISEKEIA